MKVTIRQYYTNFKGLYLPWASVPFVTLLLHACKLDSSTIVELYPPLGDFRTYAMAATVGLLLLTTFVVFSCCGLAKRIHPCVPGILIAGFVLSVCTLIALYVPFVRRIPVPSEKLEVPVSIGYQRTDFALQNYPQSNDWEMLHDRGPREEQIQMLWTLHSIVVVRVFLWLFHTLALTCFLSVASLAVYQHAADELRAKLSGLPNDY
jgi:hypothetical protein